MWPRFMSSPWHACTPNWIHTSFGVMTLFGKMHVIFYLLMRPGFQFHVVTPPTLLLLLLLPSSAYVLCFFEREIVDFIPSTTTLSIQCRLCIHKFIRGFSFFLFPAMWLRRQQFEKQKQMNERNVKIPKKLKKKTRTRTRYWHFP